MDDIMILHRIIRRLARWAAWSFFTTVHVKGSEHVPKDGPMIVTSTHHNMMIDPVVLSAAFPYSRIMHYWSKASLFKNPVMKWILESTGNIPVDRLNKDRQLLFKGTIDALSYGKAVALFPEGTSYTSPRIMQVKDGASWAALEYTRWAKQNPEKAPKKNIVILPTAIVYTEKSKYRSNVVITFGKPLYIDAYTEEFFSDKEGSPRSAVKRLTADIETALVEATINAPDWDTLYAARMARDLLWIDDKAIQLDEFVPISQTLVDLFSTKDTTPNFSTCKRNLLEYYSLLQTTRLSNGDLSALPLPRDLDPNHPTPLPGRIRTLGLLIRDSLASLARLPFFLFPLFVHAPVYAIGILSSKLVEEEESMAQTKVVIGMLVLFLIYPAAFWLLWALFWYTRRGALISAGTIWLFAVYHNRLINDNYAHAKRLIAAWRILVGVWTPKRFDLSLTALSQYQTPKIPKENEWVARGGKEAHEIAAKAVPKQEPPTQHIRRRPVPSRRIIRHVLRARAEAAKSLATMFEFLGRDGASRKLSASAHLARVYGTVEDSLTEQSEEQESTTEGVILKRQPTGTRTAGEVIGYLRQRGARIAALNYGVEGEWAALGSQSDVFGEDIDSEMDDN